MRMSVGEVCNRDVVVAQTTESLRDAAQLMRDHRVGSVVVYEENKALKRTPIGMLTDRDIVMAVLQHAKELDALFIGQAMSRGPLVLHEAEDVGAAIERLRSHAVRRAPVVDAQGTLVGIVSLDDLLEVIAEQLSGIAGLVRRQYKGAPPRGPSG
jgi:CBS domain-containing protein